MTQHSDIERLLDHWFKDGPDQAPDRVIDIVTDRIECQSQRPAWRLHRRPLPMNSYAKISVAAAAILIVALVGYNFLPGSSTGVGGPAPSPSAAPTATSSAPALSSAGPTPSPVPRLVDASAFGVPLTLTLSGDWTLAKVEPTNLELFWQGPEHVDLGFHPLSEVTLPGATITDPWISVPADFAAWVQQRPEFTAIQTRPVTVGGRTGTEIDGKFVWEGGTTKRDFLRYTTGSWLYDQYNEGHRIRFIVVPGSSADGFMIVMNAPGADFDAAAADLDRVLATVQFHAPAASPSS